MLHVTDATFQKEVLEADLPVMVDVWAEWCGPCHAIAPVVDAIAEQYEGRARVVKLNSDDNRATAQKYNILGIPDAAVLSGWRTRGSDGGRAADAGHRLPPEAG